MRSILALLFIFSTLFLTDAFSQDINPLTEKNERTRANERKHHVKSVRSYAHTVDSEGKTSRKGEPISKVIYNEQGLNIKILTWVNNSIMSSEYEYNNQGKSVKEVKKAANKIISSKTHEYNSDGKLIETRYYKADGTLNLVEKVTVKPGGSEITVYNAQGELSSKTETQYDSSTRIYVMRVSGRTGKLKYDNNYKLDEKGRILEWWMADDTQNKMTSIKFSYDENGNELEQQIFAADGSFKERNVSAYNDKGLKVEHARYQPFETRVEVMRYEYDYFDK